MSKPNDDRPDFKVQVSSHDVVAEELLQEEGEDMIQDSLPRFPPVRTQTPYIEEGLLPKNHVQSRTVIAEGAAASNEASRSEAEDEGADLKDTELPPDAQFGPDSKHQSREVDQEERKPVTKTNVEVKTQLD